jgi:hypothetical protein
VALIFVPAQRSPFAAPRPTVETTP